MAVALVAAGTPQLANGTTNGTPAIPSGSNGDMLILIATASSGQVPATPSGWNAYKTGINCSSEQLYSRSIYWRVRDGSEGATVTLNKGGNSYSLFGQVIACSGVNATHPLGAYAIMRMNENAVPQYPGIFAPAGAGYYANCFTVTTFTSVTPPAGGSGISITEVADMGSSAYCAVYGETSTQQFMPAKAWSATGGTPSNVEGFIILIMPADKRDDFIVSTGAGNTTAPSNASEVICEAVGGGGGGSVTTGAEGGGEGGSYARSNAISVTPSSSILYYSVGTGGAAGAAGNDSWARKDTNASPSGGQESTGVTASRGEGGSPAGATGGGGGTNPVGNTTSEGGDGASGQGGGGSRAGSGGGERGTGDGSTPQAGSAGASNVPGVGGYQAVLGGFGGNGGVSGSAGKPGQLFGGGGGGGGNSGGNAGAGAAGFVRLLWTLSGPVLGRADETDTAYNRGLNWIPNLAAAALEADTAFAIFPKVVLAVQRPIETDTAFNRGTVLQPQRANETDLAFALSQGVIQVPVGMATETDTAFKAGGISMAPNRPVETDSAFNRGTVLQPQRANETDTAFERPRQSAVGVSLETDTAFALGGVFIKGYTHANETDSAFALARLDTPAWTRSNETDSAFARVAGFPVVRSNETDLAFARTGVFIRATGSSTEAETAFALNAVVIRPALRSDETCTASRLGFGTPAVRANEADSAFARNALITIDHGFSIETDTAFQMFGALSAGSGRKPHLRFDGLLRDRIQPVYKGQ